MGGRPRLRVLAEIEGPDGEAHAREAVELLEPASARLELAKAHAVLPEGRERALARPASAARAP